MLHTCTISDSLSKCRKYLSTCRSAFVRPGHRWDDNIKMHLQDIVSEDVEIDLALDSSKSRDLVDAGMNFPVTYNAGKFLTSWGTIELVKNDPAHDNRYTVDKRRHSRPLGTHSDRCTVPRIIRVATLICDNRKFKSKMATARVLWNRSAFFVCALQEKIRLIRYVRMERVIHIRFMCHSHMVEFWTVPPVQHTATWKLSLKSRRLRKYLIIPAK